MDPQQFQAGAHHQGVGLADEVGLLAGGHLNGGHQGPAGGDQPLLGWTGEIGVAADEPGPLLHQMDRLADGVIVVVGGLPHDHVVRVDVAEGDAPVVQGVVQPGLPDDIGLGPRHLRGDKLRRGQGAGIEVLLIHLQPHAGELVLQLPGGLAAVVGQKQKLFLLPVQPLHELLGAGQ